MKKMMILCLLVLLFPLTAAAGVHELMPGLKLVLPEIPAPWVATREPPQALVAHTAKHIQEEAAGKGHSLSAERAAAAARERLLRNELFVVNPESGAHLLISFEPLGKDEEEPSARAIRMSAEYAAQGVGDEGWTEVSDRQKKAKIKGAQHAQRFEIDYTQEGRRNSFLGVVGFARPYWFWLYGTDHLKNAADRAVLEKIFQEMEILVEP